MRTTFKETKIGRIPEEWEVVRLDSVCLGKAEYGAGESATKYENGLVRYVRITDINADGTLNNDAVGISPEKANKYILREGDFLFARSGSIGLTYLYDARDGVCAFAGYLIRFKPRREQLLPMFLKHYCHSAIYRKWVHSTARATAQANINATEYSGLLIMLPPLPEQRKIAEILSTVDETIEKTDAIIQETQQLKKGLMQRLFTEGIGHTQFKETKIGRIPEEWEAANLSELFDVIDGDRGINYPNSDELFSRGYCVFLNAKNVTKSGFRFDEIQYISQQKDEAMGKGKLTKGDLVLTTRGTLGNFAYFDDTVIFDNLRINSGMVILRALNNIFARYYYEYLNSYYMQNQIERLAYGTAQSQLTVGGILKLAILVPPVSEQKQIAGIVSEINNNIKSEQAYKAELKQLKKGLMQVLLTGKVRVKV